MYIWLSAISEFFSEPFRILANASEAIPILFAFVLGIVGSLAPCQLTSNIGVISVYGIRSLQKKVPYQHVGLFMLGKIVAFSLLGIFVWQFGREIQRELTLYFPWVRKLVGPMLVLSGLYIAGMMKWLNRLPVWKDFSKLNSINFKNGGLGSFLMGFVFSLAFCPTMFILYFVTLLPVAFSVSYGFVLPLIFAVGTALPVFVFLFIISYLGYSGALMKKGRNVGERIQKAAGYLLMLVGVLDGLTYWS